jgi:hypothetical protein
MAQLLALFASSSCLQESGFLVCLAYFLVYPIADVLVGD